MVIDVVDAPGEPLMQVGAKTDLARSTEMDVRDLDDFHSATFSLIPKRRIAPLFRPERTGQATTCNNQSAGTGTEALKSIEPAPRLRREEMHVFRRKQQTDRLPGAGWTASDVTTENDAPSRST